MGQLVDEDAGELGAGAVERDAAFAQESAGVDRTAAVVKTANRLDADWAAAEFGEATGNRGGGAVAEKRVGGE